MDFASEYAAAVERESQLRQSAFLGLPEMVGGYELRPLTVLDFNTLQLLKSPFVCGGFPKLADSWEFIWFMSVRYDRKAWLRRKLMAWSVMMHPNHLFLNFCIRSFIADALADFPPGSSMGGKSFYSFLASVVDFIGSEYGWSRSEIINLSLKEVSQYIKAAKRRHDPKAILFNPSDPLFLKSIRRQEVKTNGN